MDNPAAASGVDQRHSDTAPRPPPAPAPRQGQLVNDKYRLDRLIARGGMGAVWAGIDMSLDRPVAIKFMDSAIAASMELRARFNQEAKAAAQLRTPHVVQIHEHGVHGRLPYIVMELLEGEDLHARLKRERRLPLRTAARILTQAAKALKKAHALSIVHRDLKPQNIFLAQQDDEEVVKILDFGIAKSNVRDRAGESTKTGVVLGSPHYMSPEQARGLKTIDHRADLWSLGVIVYRMVTGRLAFTGEATGDVIVRICTDPVRPPSEVLASLPPALDGFFERALSRAPDERYPSAMDMAQAFADIAEASHEVALFTPAPASDEVDAPTAVTTPSPEASSARSSPGLGAPLAQVDDSGAGLLAPPGPTPAPGPTPLPGSQPAGVIGAEPTPAPAIGASFPSLTDPSLHHIAGMPARSRAWLPWSIGGASAVLGLLVVLLLTRGEAPSESSASAAAGGAGPTAEPVQPGEPAQPPSASPEPDESAMTTTPSADPTVAPTTQPTARPPRRPPVSRPPRPAPSSTKSKRNWGY